MLPTNERYEEPTPGPEEYRDQLRTRRDRKRNRQVFCAWMFFGARTLPPRASDWFLRVAFVPSTPASQKERSRCNAK